MFAGLLTKVGVYAIIRTQTLLFPGGALDEVLMWAALATMLIGILGAVAQTDIRRILSFTLVSHIGYMVFGIALATVAGLAGAIFYVVHHIAIQTTLFLVAGLVERQGGSTSMDRLGGLAKASPLLAILFFVPAMNLAGIPPFSGFIGKLGLLEAGVADGSWLASCWSRAGWSPACSRWWPSPGCGAGRSGGRRRSRPPTTTTARPAADAGPETDRRPTPAGRPREAARAPALARVATGTLPAPATTTASTASTAAGGAPAAAAARPLQPLPRVMVGATGGDGAR